MTAAQYTIPQPALQAALHRALLLLLLLSCEAGRSWAQAPTAKPAGAESTSLLTYSETVEMPGTSQADLYARAQHWLATAYQTTPIAGQPAGVVEGTGWREIEMLAAGKSLPLKLWYTVRLMAQPERYTYAITRFHTQLEPTPTKPHPEKVAIEAVMHSEKLLPGAARTDYGQQAADAAQSIAETLKAVMARPPASSPTGQGQ